MIFFSAQGGGAWKSLTEKLPTNGIFLTINGYSEISFSNSYFSDAYEVLIASGDVDCKSSTQFDTSLSWNDLIQRICFYGHFSGAFSF